MFFIVIVGKERKRNNHLPDKYFKHQTTQNGSSRVPINEANRRVRQQQR